MPPTVRLDKAIALSRVGGDAELLGELAQLFLDDYPRLLTNLKNAAADQDAAALERAAHTLKGSVSNFGAQEVFDAAYRLELLGRNQELSALTESIAALENALALLRPELQALSAAI